MEKVTNEMLRDLARDFASDGPREMGANICSATKTICTMEFGCVRCGSHTAFSEGQPHPLVIVSQWDQHVPRELSLRPSTSKPRTGRGVLCLPPGAILMKKHGKGYVSSYILCKLKLRAPTQAVEEMDYLNKLDDKYLRDLKRCLEEAHQ